MSLVVFNFKDYRVYLLKSFGDKSQRNGMKSKAARFLGCHTTLISQILHGQVVVSLEHADKLNQFLGHSEEESHYFMLLVQKERAGTVSLSRYFQNQIEQTLKNQQNIKKRVGKTETVTAEDELKYYSSWQFAAIHVALSIPELCSADTIAQSLRIPLSQVRAILDFLLKTGLAVQDGNEYSIGPKHIHLGEESPQIRNHHINWRVRAIQSLDTDIKNNLHYSSAVSLAKEDIPVIKEMLIQNLKGMNKVIQQSKEQEICGLNFDFFQLKNF